MVNNDDYLLLGILTKLQGSKGSFVLALKDLQVKSIQNRDKVFVEIDGLLVPFSVLDFQEKTKEIIQLQLKGMDCETKSRELLHCKVFVNRQQLRVRKKNIWQEQILKGFSVFDKVHGFVGYAEDVMDIANNPVLIVKKEDKEHMIPMHKKIVIQIDPREQKIFTNAPEGLFDI
jgi:16S rRNA processing protein RimM